MIHVNRFQNKRFYDIPNYIIHPIKGEYMFNPELRIGEIITNADIVSTFKCGNMGGMRRSKNKYLSTDLRLYKRFIPR